MVRAQPPLLILSIACASVLALGCGDDDEPAIEEPTVASVLESPDDFDEVRLEGVASPLGSKGFVLDDGTSSIVVLGFPTESMKVDEEQVVVVARVGILEPFQVEAVRNEVRRGGGELGETDAAALNDAAFQPGSTYLDLINVRREGGS